VLDKKILCIFILLFFVWSTAATASDTAIIHGAVYEWDTFSPLENVIVEVNSTPSQSMLARYGVYSFSLQPGAYMITASYYNNNTLVSYAKENVTITDNGDYLLDLILLPADLDIFYENKFSELEDISVFAEEDKGPNYGYLIVFFIVIIIVLAAYLYTKNKDDNNKNNSDNELEVPNVEVNTPVSDVLTSDTHMDELQTLPDDLLEMIEIINAAGGRMTQRELRKKVQYSEAKVSLMLSDLEDRGIIRKFKKGRGNVVVLADIEE